jgi:hypothetical protein
MDPNAPANPAPEAAPETPAVDPAPAVDPVAPVVDEPQLTPEEQAEKDSDDEWADATKEVFPGIKVSKKDGKKDESAKPEKTAEELAAEAANPEDKKPDAEQKPGDDTGAEAKEAPTDPDAAAREARIAARQSAEQVEKVRSDVREKMFSDLPEFLQDADGDPIRSIEDVQGLIDPRTGELFTEEAAATWLLAAQQQFNQKKEEIKGQIEQIADVNMDLKDQADNVNFKYGSILKADEKLRDELWIEYEKSLVRDPETGIITKAPMSLERFYDLALKSRLETAPAAPVAPVAPVETPEQKTEREAKEKAEVDAKKQKARNERSDIYAPNTDADGAVDQEDKEWGDAAKSVFGDRLNNK